MTPMIDMTFLLLIFFMLTSKFTQEERTVDIDLPMAIHAVTPDSQKDRDIINIDGEGNYYLRDRKVDREEVAYHLRQQFKNFPPLRVYIRADEMTPARQIKQLMRMCSDAGAVDIIIGTKGR